MSSGKAPVSKAVVVRSQDGVVATRSGATGAQERKKPPKEALEEDEFTDALTKIIRRDFFPDVPKLEAQLEFIEASERNDYDKLREISERFATTSHTPGGPAATPATFETPANATPQTKTTQQKRPPEGGSEEINEAGSPPETKKPKPGEEEGLDRFLAKYHSEDDASFGELMEKAKEEHRRRHAWLYEREEEANAQAALEGPEQQLAITEGGQGKDGGKLLAIEHRPASVKTWGYTSKNSLMYIPEGVDESTKDKVEGAKKEREIVHVNTRLSRDFLKKTQAALQSATSGEGAGQGGGAGALKDKVGVDGKSLIPSESPKVNGYGFVATPQIHPGVDASPLMTWGAIEGTPFRLETDIVPSAGPSFKIPKPPRREELAHKLAEKASKATRDRKKAAVQAASPAVLRQKLGATPTATDRLQMLSPAARKLVSQATTPRSADRALRASYTPNRTPVSSSPRSTPTHRLPGSTTPSSLTDNLLNL